MKKINLLIIGLVAMFGFMFSVNAAQGVSLSCDKTTIKIGEAANCVVELTGLEANVSATTIALSTSEYLDITNVTANTAAGWSASTSGTNAANGEYAFNNANGVSGAKTQVFSFNVTLNEGAKNLSEGDSCGQLCISAVTLDGERLTGIIQGTGTCFAPTVVIEECVGESCNPQTGTFMNYMIIVGIGAIAIVGILISRKTNKFYKI